MLEPIDRISEVLFGLIMALTFTTTLDAATADGAEVRSLLIAALGCNIAWGLVDGVMYMTMGLVERGHGLTTMRALRAAQPAEARQIIRDAFPPVVAAAFSDEELDAVRTSVDDVQLPPAPRVRGDDLRGAASVALLVFLSTFPVALPFAFISDPTTALRTSNAVALVMLFTAGWLLGRYAGARPWFVGTLMAVLGAVLVVITVALGG
ncbi:MAG: hypothetical protein RJA49_1098 [Actinomycetota bacterium]